MRIIVTVASCSSAVASRRTKYDDYFRVLTLLGAQPLDAQHFFRWLFQISPSYSIAHTERYEEEAPHKADVGATPPPVCSAESSGCASS
jgi:hypothetical protein